MIALSFFRGRKVLLTGHSGFKGSWMCRVLVNAGAEVCGYSLPPDEENCLYHLAKIEDSVCNVFADIRDYETLSKCFKDFQPDIVIHMAAQPLVIDGYEKPRYTYETNVMGTVNLLDCIRQSNSVKSVLNVTTDKVYRNNEWCWGYRENEALDGYDPYSNSKSCSELVTHCYAQSFFKDTGVNISTARAGNVIGGGDFAKNRIIPDCVRAKKSGRAIYVRNPYSIRPYQHVLEAIFAYLMIVEKQYDNSHFAGNYNIGPDESDCVTTEKLVTLFCEYWNNAISWYTDDSVKDVHEANRLKLDCSLAKSVFGWKPRWSVKDAITQTCEWSKVWLNGGNIAGEMDREIRLYLESEG